MIKLYWSGGGRGEMNFGDILSPKIVEMMSGKPVVYANPDSCDMAAIGSILTKVNNKKWKRLLKFRFTPVRVWGSGTLYSHPANAFGLDIWGVRGLLTAGTFKLPDSLAIGDPGLLIDRFDIKPDKQGARYKWGIIPHIADRDAPAITEMKKAPGTLFIDLGDPDISAVIKKIRSCDFIVSTSLHGLIAADAFGIPSTWISVGDKVYGGNWKFQDYFSVVGRNEKDALTSNLLDFDFLERNARVADPALVNKCRENLDRTFRVP